MSINDAITSAQEGMTNVSQRLNGIGENVENLNTTGFRKQRFLNVLNRVPGDGPEEGAQRVVVEGERVFEPDGERVSTGVQTDFASSDDSLLVVRLNDRYYGTASGSAEFVDDRLLFQDEFVLQVVEDGVLGDWIVDTEETLEGAVSNEVSIAGILSDNGLSAGDTVRAEASVLFTEEGALRVTPIFVLAGNRQWQWFLADDLGNRLTEIQTFDVGALDRPTSGATGEVRLLDSELFESSVVPPQQFRLGDVVRSGDGFFTIAGDDGLRTENTVILGISDDGELVDTLTGQAILFQSPGVDFAPLGTVDALRTATEPTSTITLTGSLAPIDTIGGELAEPITVDIVTPDDVIQPVVIGLTRTSSNEYSVTIEVDSVALTVLGTLVTDGDGEITPVSRSIRAVGRGFDFSIEFGTESDGLGFGDLQVLSVEADGAFSADPELLLLSESGELSAVVDGSEQSVGTLQMASTERRETFTIGFDATALQVSSSALTSTVTSIADGGPEARFESVRVDRDGTTYIVFSDGTERAGGKVALISSTNVNGESPDGVWFDINASVATIVQVSEQLYAQGQGVRQGQLERSNVDLSGEFSELILAQRGYQALSQVMSVGDEMLDTLLRHS